MGREQDRIRQKMEANPIGECNKVRRRYCPNLFQDFAATKDPRHLGYTDYSNKEMLGSMFYKGIAGISSMRSMTYEFNREEVVVNLYHFLGESEKDYLPHGVTLNEYFEKLDPSELQYVQQKQVYEMIRRKSFDDARFGKKWLVIVDGTQTYSGNRRLNESCLERHFKTGTEEETVNYHCDVLEAKIVFILADSLYASEPVMEICRDNKWDFIIRYKSGSIPSITEEYEKIPEKETAGHAEFVNDIDYNGYSLNMLRYWEEKLEKGETVRTEFQWLMNIRATKRNAEKIASAGRHHPHL